MSLRTLGLVLASIVLALWAWPTFVHRSGAMAIAPATATPLPVKHDEIGRDETIRFLENHTGKDPIDFLSPRMLSNEYLQRFIERGDPGDLQRAAAAAERSIRANDRSNPGGYQSLAQADLAMHRFRDAQRELDRARVIDPHDVGLDMQAASIAMELGDYARAHALIARYGADHAVDVATTRSRYEEVTGDVHEARDLLEAALRNADTLYDMTAERRAWYYFRAGELAFLTGDNDAAISRERTALAMFPDDVQAHQALARIYASCHRWREALDVAQDATRLAPSVETLGVLADAQAALGSAAAAAATRDQIIAIERVGNASRLNDRLIAVYYADHGIRQDDAYAIAVREHRVRADVYADDTLAWTAARSGRWDVARAAIRRALAYHTADSRLDYHAGYIALHDGRPQVARRYFTAALALNPSFHPTEADDARSHT